MRNLSVIKKLVVSLIFTTLVVIISAAILKFDLLTSWENKITDTLYNSENRASQEIVIVAVDPKSLDEFNGLGRFFDWSREYYAQAMENITQNNPKVIGFDLLFSNYSQGISGYSLENLIKSSSTNDELFQETVKYTQLTDHPEDAVFKDALESFPDTVLASSAFLDPMLTDYWTIDTLVGPVFEPDTGVVKVVPDDDGIVRKIPLFYHYKETNEFIDSFDIAVVKKYLDVDASNIYEDGYVLGDTINIPTEKSEMKVNYFGEPYSYKYLSFVDVYNGEIKSQDIEGKIVLIGVAEETLKDIAFTPVSKIAPMPGVEVHANAIQTILSQEFLVDQGFVSQIIVVLLIALISVLIFMYLPLYVNIPYLVVVFGGYFGVASFTFNKGLVIGIIVPLLAVLVIFISTYLYRFFTEKKKAKETRSAFSHYVSKDVVDEIMKNPDMLTLGGKKQVATMFFSDIVGFTSMSEKMSPEQVVSQLNEYFSIMSQVIFKNKGTLDKFEGDAIMAFYGAPMPDPYHAVHACKTALECRKVLIKLNDYWKKNGKPQLDFRVGINTGEVIVGNIGSKERFDYTVIGDAVNLASRLEGVNKQLKTRILVSEATFNQAKEHFKFKQIRDVSIKGKEETVNVYELMG